MGAAASVESGKPADASDIRSSESLEVARGEIIRLRESLGHLAKNHPSFAEKVLILDASDLVLGDVESEDFERCCSEIAHIRAALRLSTQSSKRRERAAVLNVFDFGRKLNDGEEDDDSKHDDSSSSDSSSDSDLDMPPPTLPEDEAKRDEDLDNEDID
jgi:hypothetical protein